MVPPVVAPRVGRVERSSVTPETPRLVYHFTTMRCEVDERYGCRIAVNHEIGARQEPPTAFVPRAVPREIGKRMLLLLSPYRLYLIDLG